MAVQTPQYKIDSIDALQSTPVVVGSMSALQLLSNLVTVERRTEMAVVNHYNVQPVVDVYANVQDRNLGAVARAINSVVAEFQSQLPRGSSIVVRGQAQSMNDAFVGLGAGMVFAIVLVYMLMVVNFQSWRDPHPLTASQPPLTASSRPASRQHT